MGGAALASMKLYVPLLGSPELWLTFMHTPGEDNERHALQRVWSIRVGLFHGHGRFHIPSDGLDHGVGHLRFSYSEE
jgi:hypothetical protein